MIVYLVTNTLNGKKYVGKTTRTLALRWSEHVYHALNGDCGMPLYSAIRKYGPEAFQQNVLQECESPGELNEVETAWIEKLGTFQAGYNATLGGDGPSGYHHSEETRRKMSESRLGKKLGPMSAARRQRMLDRHFKHSEESRVKMSQALVGRKHTVEARKKISESQYKRVAQLDTCGCVSVVYDSVVEAERVTGIKRQGISRSCRFPTRTAGGFHWQYLTNEKSNGVK